MYSNLTEGELTLIAAIATEEVDLDSLPQSSQYGVGMFVAAYVQHEGDMEATHSTVTDKAGEIGTDAEFQDGVEIGARIAHTVRNRFMSERGNTSMH